MIKVFTAFSGYDSQCLALERIGVDYELVGWSEIDRYAIKAHDVLFPKYSARNFGDISKIDWSQVPDFDLFTYSFPCQDISLAGRRNGLDQNSGTRSSLLWECEKAIKAKHPKYLLMENVKALVGTKFRQHFERWLCLCDTLGYTSFALVLNAKDYGVPQNRERIFMVSIYNPENDWISYYFPQPIKLRKRMIDCLEDNVNDKYYLSAKQLAGIIESSKKELKKGNSFTFSIADINDVAHTITTRSGGRKTDNFIAEPIVLGWSRSSVDKNVSWHIVNVANCVTVAKRPNSQNYIVEPINTDKDSNTRTVTTQYGKKGWDGIINGKMDKVTALIEYNGELCRVRKLTPRECFRLMDVDDSDFDKLQAAGISNSQLYKLAGNSIVINVLCCIFRQLFNKNLKN